MDFQATLEAFFQSQAGQLSLWVLIVAGLDFALGTAAAFRDSTFSLDSWAAWGRKHIMGRVVPAWILLFVGDVASGAATIPGTDVGLFSTFGVIFAGTYIAETFGSIMDSWGSKSTTAPAFLQRDDAQPVPKD